MSQKEVHLDRSHPSYASIERQYAPLCRRSGKKNEQKGHDDHQQDWSARHLGLKIQDLTTIQSGIVVGEFQTSLDVQTHH